MIPAGNIFATADETSRFFQMLLDGGVANSQQLLKAETVARIARPLGRMNFDRTLMIPMRYSEGMMTLVTTNLGRDDFMKRYFVGADGAVDGAIESRIAREQGTSLPWWRPLPEGDLRGASK